MVMRMAPMMISRMMHPHNPIVVDVVTIVNCEKLKLLLFQLLAPAK